MERVSEVMTGHSCRGGLLVRPSLFLIKAAFLAFIFITPAKSQIYDIITVAKPRYLTAYDAFQQSLSSSQLLAIRPFVPIKILKSSDFLSDGFTKCMKVEIEGEIFFLLTDNKGMPAEWNKLGTVKVYKHKRFLQDTVEILESQKIKFQNNADGSSKFLAAGDLYIRYFEDAGSFYVRRIGKISAFGWIRISGGVEGKLWKIVHPAVSRQGLSAAMLERISGRIRQFNHTISKAYALLNKEYGKQLTPPQWYIKQKEDSLSFIFEPDSAVVIYPNSIDLLKNNLQTYLLGTGYTVVTTGNLLEIKSR